MSDEASYMKLPRMGVNFYKVIVGVGFSLLWARAMYLFWPQPSYITFVWFYLIIGSILLKWVIFEIIDRINLRARLRIVRRELDESNIRVREAGKEQHQEDDQPVITKKMSEVSCEEKLKQLKQEVLSLGNMVEMAIERSVESVRKRDINLARQIIEHDDELDQKRATIERDCMQIIATDCPEDTDLRAIVAVLGIITELERMGDYAEGIANITLMIGDEPHLKPLADIFQMANRGIDMLRGGLEAFTAGDVDKAKRICQQDDEVDALYDKIFRELILFVSKRPETITQVTWLIWIAHNLERFADRVTNICERVVFSVTGEIVDIGVSKY
jgi:phosphate transport system protein